MMSVTLRWLALGAGAVLTMGACNMLTGADDIETFASSVTGEPESDEMGSEASGGRASGPGESEASSTSLGGSSPGGEGGTSATGGTSAAGGNTGAGGTVAAGGDTGAGGTTSGTGGAAAGPWQCTGASNLDGEESAFLGLINAYRAEHGLAALVGCNALHRAAQTHSEDMRDEGYFSHTSLDGTKFYTRAGICGGDARAENIAAGHSGAEATFLQWKNSPGHDRNMRGSYKTLGIGRATGGGPYGVYWTNVFGISPGACN